MFLSLLFASSAMYAAQPQDVRFASPTPNITRLTNELLSQTLRQARAAAQQRGRDARRSAQQIDARRSAQ